MGSDFCSWLFYWLPSFTILSLFLRLFCFNNFYCCPTCPLACTKDWMWNFQKEVEIQQAQMFTDFVTLKATWRSVLEKWCKNIQSIIKKTSRKEDISNNLSVNTRLPRESQITLQSVSPFSGCFSSVLLRSFPSRKSSIIHCHHHRH